MFNNIQQDDRQENWQKYDIIKLFKLFNINNAIPGSVDILYRLIDVKMQPCTSIWVYTLDSEKFEQPYMAAFYR